MSARPATTTLTTTPGDPHRDPTTSSQRRAPTGHIGRIVAACLIGGMAAATALLIGPLAGAPEHVVTGSVLLTFALAWAMLAGLSQRRTDQPQRWALVPATAMAISGVTILALAPTGNEAGWLWPPAVAALSVWMIVRARRALHSRTRVWMVYPVCVALFLSAVGGAYETYREHQDQAIPMPGRLVDVGGHRLHIDCTGTGTPTVVLEPGLGEISTSMAWIAPEVTTTTRVCVYDRAGRGWSDEVDEPQDGVQVATDLHTLLERAGEQGPYVLAGHSAGGLYVMNFARLFPSDVAGVALLDSMSPDQYTAIDGWSSFYEMYRRASAVLPSLSRLGIGRAIYDSAYGGLPAPARDAERALLATPRSARSTRDEFSQIRTTMSEAKDLTTLGDLPLVVLTAQNDAQGGWDTAQASLARLSTDSVHRSLADADHADLVEDQATAARSAQAIKDVVEAVRWEILISDLSAPGSPS